MKKVFLSLVILIAIVLSQISHTYAMTETYFPTDPRSIDLNVHRSSSQIDAANFLASMGIIVDNSIDPSLYDFNAKIQRQAFMKIVMKLSGKNIPDVCRGDFADVDKNDWPCKYIEAALDAGFITKNKNFRPYDFITMTEAMKLVLKSKGITKIQTTDNWQKDYMLTALEYGIIETPYYDFDVDATRGWIFELATATIQKEETIKQKGGIISDEVNF